MYAVRKTGRARCLSAVGMATLLLGLAGCASQSPPPQTVQVIESGQAGQQTAVAPAGSETLQALNQLTELKEELKQLRNAVEEIQFETENAKRRQQDLFQDLDRRLLSLERNQSLVAPQPADAIDPAVDPALAGQGTDPTAGGATDIQGATPGAAGASQVTVVPTPGSGPTDTTAAIGTASAGAVSVDEEQAYEAAFNQLKQSRYQDAIVQFQQFADTWPNSQLADDAYYWMSEARYVNREFEDALGGFRTVVTRYPDSQRVPEALLKIGYIQYDIGAYNEAADTFRDILARFPGHQVTVSAQTRLRRIEQTIQN